jgi:hypothetical protein
MTGHTLLRAVSIASVLVVAVSSAATAQSVRLIGEYRDWSAYSAVEGTDTICFAMSKPREVVPTPDGLTDAYLYLTHRPAENINHEFNLVAGFSFATDTTATVSVSGQSFDLFTENDAAWLLDPAQNDDLAGAMRAGTALVIDATTDKGIKVQETFSLSGATAASRAIDGEC